MIPALTLEPLSWDDLPEAAVLWADPAGSRGGGGRAGR